MGKPAPKGNQYAKGNKGGYAMPKEYRDKQVCLKTLMLEELIRIMQGDNKAAKFQVILKHGGKAMPTEIEGMGEDGTIIVKLIDYAKGDRVTTSIRSGQPSVPVGGAVEPGPV